MNLAGRAAAGQFDPEVCQWLRLGLASFQRTPALGLERCLRLPSPSQQAKARRNIWLCRAAVLLGLDRDMQLVSQTTIRLEKAWAHFLSRGNWRAWQSADTPAADATQLDRCLFHASRHSDGKCLSLKQIERILATGSPDIFGAGNVDPAAMQ